MLVSFLCCLKLIVQIKQKTVLHYSILRLKSRLTLQMTLVQFFCRCVNLKFFELEEIVQRPVFIARNTSSSVHISATFCIAIWKCFKTFLTFYLVQSSLVCFYVPPIKLGFEINSVQPLLCSLTAVHNTRWVYSKIVHITPLLMNIEISLLSLKL